MKIEIWSDKVCPFCYIGKRKFELALNQFEHKDQVTVQWKSFQLDPSAKFEEGKTIYQWLAEKKGWPIEQIKQVSSQIIDAAKEVRLDLNYDRIIPANTFDAHRFTRYAADFGKQQEAEDLIFKAHFNDGENIEDHNVLVKAGNELEMPEKELSAFLASDKYSAEVNAEIEEAAALGVRGVPFFVLNRQYAVSGAQSPDAFLSAIRQAWIDYTKSNKLEEISADGAACQPGGVC